MLTESYSEETLDGLSVNNVFDNYLRRTAVEIKNDSTSLQASHGARVAPPAQHQQAAAHSRMSRALRLACAALPLLIGCGQRGPFCPGQSFQIEQQIVIIFNCPGGSVPLTPAQLDILLDGSWFAAPHDVILENQNLVLSSTTQCTVITARSSVVLPPRIAPGRKEITLRLPALTNFSLALKAPVSFPGKPPRQAADGSFVLSDFTVSLGLGGVSH
jgi:hypothetical protein